MPTKQYIVTIITGDLSGISFIRYSQEDAEHVKTFIKIVYNAECKIEIIDLK